MPRPESPRSPSRFIYERSPSILRRDDNPPSIPPSEDGSGTPEYYDRFSPAQHYGHPQFASHVPHETRMEAGPYPRDVTPNEQISEDGTNTMMYLFTDDGVPEHVAHALNDRRFRYFAARHVHDLCLGVSQDFIQDFRRNIEQRLSEHQENESGRFPGRFSIFDHTALSLYRRTHVTDSLTTNTTGICSILWARGSALQMLSPGSVSKALDEMRVVNEAAEDIVRISDIVLQRGNIHEEEVMNVRQAGMMFCERLGYRSNREDLENWLLVFQ
ncbi:hypothetical protein CEP54_010697 [Fusarium duplospermum]|uniref:Uncharacterized protein n=1 Tax=Fusarium duplospermum TaxID=1325734 RepID=A0A428PIR2_9HYPO|nr:hypothetical protein CEP54_010697 [Fusarium duplospermum]